MKQKSNSQLLIFKINKSFFAIETEHIKEIVENTKSFPIPLETPHIDRIFIHRNEAIAVLNTQYYFETTPLKLNFYLVLKDMIALPVDELGGIFNAGQFAQEETKIKSPFLKEIFYINEQAVSVINYQELNSHEGKTILFPI